MARQSAKLVSPTRPIRFIDAFAGPGVYKGGEPGSPVLAIEAVLNHAISLPVPLECIFIEKDPRRYQSLLSVLAPFKERIEQSQNLTVPTPLNDDCVPVLQSLLDEAKRRRRPFGPALVFLDQFGYSDVPMSLVKRIMAVPQCEVFTYLNYEGMNRFLADPTKDSSKDAAFGCDEWRAARDLSAEKQRASLLSLYKASLRDVAGAKFVWDFAMADCDDKLLYWLFFCSNNLRGLEEMKKAMWKVDEDGTFRFADSDDPAQLKLIKSFDDEWLAEHLPQVFSGRTVSVEEIKMYVLTGTPCYKYASVIQKLQRQGKVVPVGQPTKISFKNDLKREVSFRNG